jgi:tetratricopeptide (TPR) repeat protein
VLLTLSQLGELYKQEGLLSEAAKTFAERVTIAEKIFGKDQPRTADSLSDLGNVYRVEGRREDAKRLYDRAITIRIAAFGPDHPDIGTSYNSLGSFYSEGGDQIAGQQYFEKALAVWEKAYGKDSTEIYPALLNLGQTLQARGDLVGARRLFERARTLLEAARGPEDLDVANAIWNLGALSAAEHHYTEALALEQQALKVYEKLEDVTDIADCMADQIEPLRALGRLDDAEALAKHTLELETKAYGADHVNVGKVLEATAKVEMNRRHYARALDDATQSLNILEAKDGKDHPDVAVSALDVGRALTALNRAREAVPFEERALAIDMATKQLPAVIADARFGLAEALAHDPKQRVRAITEAKTALADADDKAAIRTWLRAHH